MNEEELTASHSGLWGSEQQLAALLTQPKEEKGNSVKDTLDLIAVLNAVSKIDIDQVLEEKAKMPLTQQQLVRRLEAGQGFRQQLGKKVKRKPGPKKKHWKAKRAVKRAKDKRYRDRRRKVLRRERLKEAAKDASSCYRYKLQRWLDVGMEVSLSEIQWVEEVWPSLGGVWPSQVMRYDKKGPVSLGNVYILDDRRNTIFDGKEHLLRKKGYIQ